MESFRKYCSQLEDKIKATYESGVTMEDAEKLAAEFLHAQMQVSAELKKSDLDTRMRKTGLKAIKAAVYMEAATKDAKKPSDVMLEQLVNSSEIVSGEQERFDQAETSRDELERLYNVFREAHVYYRGIAKGRFE